MARGRRRTNYTPDAIISQSLDDSLLRELTPWPSLPVSPLTEIEDRRQFHPDGFFRAWHEVDGRRGDQLQVKPSKMLRNAMQYMSSKVQFRNPDKTIVCVRRKSRREVLFAKRKAGGGSRRRPRRNWLSDVSC